jgi:hypothetical protein
VLPVIPSDKKSIDESTGKWHSRIRQETSKELWGNLCAVTDSMRFIVFDYCLVSFLERNFSRHRQQCVVILS